MRPSNRTIILAAAAAVVQREGVTSLTLESVAAQAGLTKGGLMYHFPTRDALLQAVHEHLAEQWDTDMTAVAGRPATDTDDAHRLAAYVQVATHSATRAELLFMLEAATHPEHMSPWAQVIDRWAPPPPLGEDTAAGSAADTAAGDVDDAALTAFVARLAADGLWMYESLTDTPLPGDLRRRLAGRITQIADADLAGDSAPTPRPDTPQGHLR